MIRRRNDVLKTVGSLVKRRSMQLERGAPRHSKVSAGFPPAHILPDVVIIGRLFSSITKMEPCNVLSVIKGMWVELGSLLLFPAQVGCWRCISQESLLQIDRLFVTQKTPVVSPSLGSSNPRYCPVGFPVGVLESNSGSRYRSANPADIRVPPGELSSARVRLIAEVRAFLLTGGSSVSQFWSYFSWNPFGSIFIEYGWRAPINTQESKAHYFSYFCPVWEEWDQIKD